LVPPTKSRLIEEYALGSSKVRIYACRGELDLLYQITPWEYTLSTTEMEMLVFATDWMKTSSPPEKVLDGDELRHWVSSMALIRLRQRAKELRTYQNLDPMAVEVKLQSLAEVVTRYTAGLGLFGCSWPTEDWRTSMLMPPANRIPFMSASLAWRDTTHWQGA
jgi:hypothetical protein